MVGDASMAPEELVYASGALYWGEEDDRESSLRWLERLRDRFRHSVWLNPIPKEIWPNAYGRTTIHKIGEVFHMEDLTPGRHQAGGGVVDAGVASARRFRLRSCRRIMTRSPGGSAIRPRKPINPRG